VVTSRIALGPRTLDLRRFLYAIDETDGSVIVFDVTEGSAALTPLTRPHPELNPFQPIDRVRFNSPPRDLIVLQHASDEPDDDTGATLPVRCDPDPDASGPGTKYRTSAGFDSGAGPRRLRGVFAFAVLASGDIVVIDVDDYDASCRGPKDQHALFGCDGDAQGLATSGEYSCLVSVPHQPRAGGYLVQQEGVAANEPGLQALPLFFDEAGALVPLVRDGVPTGAARMRATIPASEAPRFELVVGAEVQSLDPASGLLAAAAGGGDPAEHTLAMNLGDPRAHILAQSWKVTFEGALPGFVDHFASLAAQASGGFTLTDAAGRFCTRGVLGQAYWQLRLVEEGLAPAAVTAQSAALADYVQVTSDSPVATDKYWSEQQSCSLNACLQFYGSSDSPREARDLRIVEATESSLELVRRGPTDPGAPSLTCCFPHVLEFRVRGGNQWIVLGSEVGLLHHVVPNDDGVCRPACDPNRALLTGRVRETAPDAIVSDDDPLAFRNPFFRLSINQGADASRRDMHFDFATQAPFGPLTLSVASSTANVQPTAVTYLDVTGELVVSDGSLEGITFVDLGTLAITRQYR
jgi:hypothetical protein